MPPRKPWNAKEMIDREIIERAAKARAVSTNSLATTCGVPESTLRGWLNGTRAGLPTAIVRAIAAELGVEMGPDGHVVATPEMLAEVAAPPKPVEPPKAAVAADEDAMAQEAIDNLYSLMHNAKSETVRLQAASQIRAYISGKPRIQERDDRDHKPPCSSEELVTKLQAMLDRCPKCPQCGHIIGHDDNFCGGCGVPYLRVEEDELAFERESKN